MISRILTSLFLIIGLAASAQNIRYGITNRTGNFIPGNITLYNQDSIRVNFKNSINKPTILVFVYYRCPGICSTVLNGLVEVINKSELVPGIDYQIATISIQASETPALAKQKRQNYLSMLKNKIADDSWQFYTADSATVSILTNTCGFEFQRINNEITHPATLIVLTPNGMISQYLYGTFYLPMDLEMAVRDAKLEKADISRVKAIKYCRSKKEELNPIAEQYIVFSGLIAGIIIFGILLRLLLKKRFKNKK